MPPPAATVLITRSREDAAPLAAQLQEHGVTALIEPLLSIRFLPVTVESSGIDGFLFTSANGVRALVAGSDFRAAPALCVGEQTGAVAQAVGFADVRVAGGDVASLAELVIKTLQPSDGPLVHVAATVVAGDLMGRLRQAQFEIRRLVAYEAIPARHFTPATLNAIQAGKVNAVFLYSPRTARTFSALAEQANLRESCESITAYCLSEAVAAGLPEGLFHRVRSAAIPNGASLLAAFLADDPRL